MTLPGGPPDMPPPRLPPLIPLQVGEYPSSTPTPAATLLMTPTCQVGSQKGDARLCIRCDNSEPTLLNKTSLNFISLLEARECPWLVSRRPTHLPGPKGCKANLGSIAAKGKANGSSTRNHSRNSGANVQGDAKVSTAGHYGAEIRDRSNRRVKNLNGGES